MDDTTGTTDAISLLTSQHREVEALWTRLEAAGPGSGEATELASTIVKLLSQHDAIETQLLYPAVREADGGDQLADHSLEEHQQVRELLKQVDKGDVHDPATFAVLRQAIEAVQAHVEEEEGLIFPKLRQACGTEELHALAEKMEVAMKVAPTHPHPTTPNNPIGAAAAGMVTGAVDKLRDAISSDR